ncbi:putative low-complexity protein [Xenococcus sp. PCC 7305]|uniref:pentapeptide repeat-containing protein n=1 Tax=Xenococcus sp. PCC 7305 TaxID=102125 RepID=UPI0002ACB8AB|nr:pentapeptide repeat-containing protein [Xenococcus sp. PCC 7305]ELS03476.1 putative low-complexity protein [Xenococcus sp. PCC 7305]
MKASEVLARYAAGERNFRGKNLRGQSFKGTNLSGADFTGTNLSGADFTGANLSGADFSGAEIRSTNFTGANLLGADFSGAKTGLQFQQTIKLVIISWLLSGLSGLISGLASFWVLFIFRINIIQGFIVDTILFIFVTVFLFLTVVRGLLSGIIFGTVAFALAGAFAFSKILSAPKFIDISQNFWNAFSNDEILIFTVFGAITAAIVGVIAFYVAIVLSITFSTTVAGANWAAITWIVSVALSVGILRIFTVLFSVHLAAVILTAIVVIVPVSLVSILISWSTLTGEEKHEWIRKIAIIYAATGGTSFRSADLTEANFTRAKLRSTDLREATLTRTSWHQAKNLDLVRPGETYLRNVSLRQLLITGEGQNQNFNRQNLRGVNLQKANLTNASFIDTDLSQANLKGANLFEAKLVQTNLDQTNLSNAHLTGAYIEDWGITRGTRLEEVECKYVYLKLPTEGDRDPNRMPPSEQGEFGENDFNIFITSVLDTLDLYHRQNINAGVAITVLKGLTEDYPVQFELVGLEKRGDDQFVIRLKVFGKISHFKIQREYYDRYEQTLPLYDPKKLIPNTDVAVEKIVKTVKENPSTHIENLHNQGIVITGGKVDMSGERNIEIKQGNYNENIQGDYYEQK